MAEVPDKSVAGHAALSICESLLIAMRGLELMTEKDVRDVLQDAATAHREESRYADNDDLHKKVAGLIERIIAGRNSLPRI
jgi:hypothetical protein